MKSLTSLIRFRNAVGMMLALSAIFAVAVSTATLNPDRASADGHPEVNLSLDSDSTTFLPQKNVDEDVTSVTVHVHVGVGNLASQMDIVIPLTVAATTDTADKDADYTVPDTLSVTAGTDGSGTITEKFTIKIVDDELAEFPETFTVSLGTLPDTVRAGDNTSVTITITDDDNENATGSVTIDNDNDSATPLVPKVGDTLTVDTSDILDTDNAGPPPIPLDFTYKWLRTNTTRGETGKEVGEDSATYLLTTDDLGATLEVQVTSYDQFKHSGGSPFTVLTKNAVGYNMPTPYIIVGALVNDRLTAGVTLTADISGFAGLMNRAPTPQPVTIGATNVRWLRDGSRIMDGANEVSGLTYDLAGDDIGTTITAVATWDSGLDDAQNMDIMDVSDPSNSVGPVVSANAPTADVTISGVAQVGETVTAMVDSIADADADPMSTEYPKLSGRYEWLRDGAAISGQSGMTYTLADADAGKTIQVTAFIQDGTGDEEGVTSAPNFEIAEAGRGDGGGGGGAAPGALISRIEPAVRSVTLSADDTVTLGVLVYGLQDAEDSELGEGNIAWTEDDASLDGSGVEIEYTAPSSPGSYTVKAMTAAGTCEGDDAACSATITVRVRRPSAPQPAPEAPANPTGDIPSVIADADGNQYEVFTPEGGGTFDAGEGYSIRAEAGAVPNGEFIGIRMSDEGAASNAGMTHQRYTVGGNAYAVSAVDGSGASVSSYVLDEAATVCIPLPDELRSNISNVALVVINSDGTLTTLSGGGSVHIGSGGASVCGSLSSLPASVAVGSEGAPAAIPTPTPEPTPEPPDTGGTAPASSGVVLWALLLGLAIATFGGILTIARRRESTSK